MSQSKSQKTLETILGVKHTPSSTNTPSKSNAPLSQPHANKSSSNSRFMSPEALRPADLSKFPTYDDLLQYGMIHEESANV